MADSDPGQKRRKRGYSLRTQLFFKNSQLQQEEQKQKEDLELGLAGPRPSPTVENIELRTLENDHIDYDTSQNDSYINETVSQNNIKLQESSDEQDHVRHGPLKKAYAGHRGTVRKKFVNFKNLIFNIRPYRTSKDGRKIPVSVLKDYDESKFPTTSENGSQILVDERYFKAFIDNTISSSRYSLYSFLPKQMYAQFSKIANIYFMTVSILQMIPSWSTTGTYTTIVPLLIFITISMLREGFDDWRRHLQDNKENNKYTKIIVDKDYFFKDKDPQSLFSLSRTTSATSVSHLTTDFHSTADYDIDEDEIDSSHSFKEVSILKQIGLKVDKIKWKDIKVGDIIKLEQDEPVPADIVLLTSDGQNENEVLIETMDLDGETNLKAKLPHPKVSAVVNTAKGLKRFRAIVTTEDPNPDLYNFEGNIKVEENLYPLGPDNIVYRGSIVRNTKNLVGLVIFTGEETKIRMNAIKNPRTKAPKLQKSINMIVAFMVFVVLCLAFFSFMAQRLLFKKYANRAWYLYKKDTGVIPTIMSFIIMYNTLIPLSLYVTTEIIKIVQMLFLHWDIDMYHQPSNTPCEARTATILEELGQVSYIFSDKTGTLTDNLMIFRNFSVAGTAWYHEIDNLDSCSASDDSIDLAKPLNEQARGSFDIKMNSAHYAGRSSLASAVSNSNTSTNPSKIKNTYDLLVHIQQNPNSIFSKKAKFFILSLALCHTCLPKTASEDDDEMEYQSSSPDELALVIAARDMGYIVYGKNAKDLIIRIYPNGVDSDPVDETYEVLNVVEFSSARKRMSTIVRFPDNRICLICKGADNVILERLNNFELAKKKKQELNKSVFFRKQQEAQLVLQQRQSMDMGGASSIRKSFQIGRSSLSRPSLGSSSIPRLSMGASSIPRPSMGALSIDSTTNTISDYIQNSRREECEIDEVIMESRKSLNLQQAKKYNITSVEDYIGNDKQVLNEEYVLEKTLQHIDEFSTDGLRTLMYAYRWLEQSEYENWADDYAKAKVSLIKRAEIIEEVGGALEVKLNLCGATAIEDKLQDGVSQTIEKMRKAGIKLWMLTGDKRETAINIGYSCKLIKDYSTLVILDSTDEDITAKLTASELEIDNGNVAHCVLVIDGATLSDFEADSSLLSIFISLCTKTDSVICCRASPSQKAMMVSSIRNLQKNKVTLAIGDGANDIAMIQSADIGIGITGKEGLQAARSSDYSIAQFKYLQKLLLVHGRYNYIRTSKFVLSTFYKELLFYLSQAIFQRNAMFTGTSLYESWSLSMFNTLFTSLPVLCIGMFEKDLKPATLLAIPELYAKGRLNQGFNLRIFIGWMLLATATSLLICFTSWNLWGLTASFDNSLYPAGTITYTTIVFTINIKLQWLEQHNRTYLNACSTLISCLGWLLWCCILPALYKEDTSKIYDVFKGLYWKFGKDVTWWAAMWVIVVMAVFLDYIVQVLRFWFFPTEADEVQILEHNTEIRREIELSAFPQMQQGWGWPQDPPAIKRYINRKRQGTVTLSTELPPGTPSKVQKASSTVHNDGEYETEILPSGKLIKRKLNDSKVQKLGKKLRFVRDEKVVPDEDVDAIIQQRMQDLE